MGKPVDLNLLICPNCKSNIYKKDDTYLACNNCNSEFIYENSKLIFKKFNDDNVTDSLDKIKSLFKKWHKIYDLLIRVLSPVLIRTNLKNFINENISNDKVALNLGSGNSDISEKITNIDIFPYKNVNICCDIENLPFSDCSVDVIINIAVLEHVPDPVKVVNEIYRVLKKGGKVYTYYPFIQPFHASPYDYSRKTIEGIKILHKEFIIEEVKTGSGPTSGFLWVFQEWIAILLSFGNEKIHNYIYLLIMILTFPLKYLDLILSKYSTSKNIASAFILIAKK